MKRLLLRGWHLLYRIIGGVKQFPKHKNSFGFHIAWIIFIDGLIPPGKSQNYINKIEKFVSDYLRPLVEKYQNDAYLPHKMIEISFDKVPVWCCWWQGEDKMPGISKNV